MSRLESRDVILWFSRLVRRDMALFEVDVGKKEQLYRTIMGKLKKRI